MSRIKTLQDAFESEAGALREFGYPDVTASMISDVWTSMGEGKSGHDLPHGIVGLFAERHLSEVANKLRTLSAE